MATAPNWIGINRGGEWIVTLTTQVGTRTGTPPADGLLATVTSAAGGYIESIFAKPLGTNVDSVLFLYVQKPNNGTYHLFASQDLGTSTAPAAGADTGMAQIAITELPTTLFPSSNTTTANRGFRLAPGTKIFAALDTAVASGWVIGVNGGEC